MQASGKWESYYSLKRASESLFIKVEINDSKDAVISTVQDLGLEQVSYSMNFKSSEDQLNLLCMPTAKAWQRVVCFMSLTFVCVVFFFLTLDVESEFGCKLLE